MKSLVAAVSLALLLASSGCDLLKPKAKKAYGQDCSADTDCESLTCATYGSVCSKACTYNKECEGGLVCRGKDEGPGQVCSKPVGAAPNASCMSGADCQHGWCLKRVGESDAPGICSHHCAAPEDCPAGMKICDSISDSGALKMCLPGDEKAPASARPKFGPPSQGKRPAAAKPAVTGQPTGTAQAAPPDAGAKPAPDAGPPADAGAKPADAGATPPAGADAGPKPPVAGDAGRGPRLAPKN